MMVAIYLAWITTYSFPIPSQTYDEQIRENCNTISLNGRQN